MQPTTLILLSLVVPAIATAANMALSDNDNWRDGATLVASLVTFALVVALAVSGEYGAAVTVFSVMPGLELSFHVEPLGLLFALVASGLWIVTHIYAIGYMRGNNEHHQTRFFAFFSFSIAATMGIAFSANLFTLFLFYELLTLSTYPLVAHKETDEAKAGARTYLGILMSTSIVFLLVAVIWTWIIAGTTDFTLGGILAGNIEGPMVAVLLGLFAFGIGKAALMPFHRWLPAAMVAPTPVSALLHAVAVVKAGVFTMLKVGVYIFGIDFLSSTSASDWLVWLASASILIASVIALTKDNLKARLAYSTVSQLSYITLGMALATSMGVVGGGMHIAMHAAGKITLFMCAGAIYVAHHKTLVSELNGIGRKMPLTMAAFMIGALSIIGLPPFGGMWSKWLLGLAALDAGQVFVVAVLMLSSLLNVAYLLSIVARAFFLPADDGEDAGAIAEAPVACLIALVATALLSIVLFFQAGAIERLLAGLIS